MEECKGSWMRDIPASQVESSSGGSASVSIGPVTFDYGNGETITTTLTGGQGYVSMCAGIEGKKRLEAASKLDACFKRVEKAHPGVSCAS
jgi:hypothetical protein